MNGDQATPQNQTQQPAAPAQSGPEQKPVVLQKIQAANNILVAVSSDPTIDQLSSAIALTLLLEKFNKNATAVFSGKVPSALEFLKPGETFEKTIDSLRDFIIAIDKSKADKLRYKVEDNVVKIFITPYKTSITEKDLQYNAGDFNVDLIIALGVKHQQDLDMAITAHGRIFHDAVVVSINNVAGGDFGVANWEDFSTSSLSELIAGLSGDLGPNLLDSDIATALLTGIVAETSRFSNDKTHPGTMSISSRLLEAGADQQLVNQQLQSEIGTGVQLQAGTQIKPTMTPEQMNTELPKEHEELVVGDDGTLNLPGLNESKDTQPAAAPADKPADPATEVPKIEITPAPVEATETPKAPEVVDYDTDLVLPGAADDTTIPAAPALSPASDDPDEAEAARKAIDDALKNAAAQTGTQPAINIVPAPSAPEAPEVPAPSLPEFEALESEPAPTQSAPLPAPALTLPPQPAFTPPQNPQLNQSTVPAIGSEPAPLASSPADQPFTMPMPPTSSMTQAPPMSLPSQPAIPGGLTPPPMPPPMAPPVQQ